MVILRLVAYVADRSLNLLCPMRGADRGQAAAHELASTTTTSTTTGCATTGGAGHPKK